MKKMEEANLVSQKGSDSQCGTVRKQMLQRVVEHNLLVANLSMFTCFFSLSVFFR